MSSGSQQQRRAGGGVGGEQQQEEQEGLNLERPEITSTVAALDQLVAEEQRQSRGGCGCW